MTRSELEALREKLIEAVVEAIDKIFDTILMPVGPKLDPPKPVRWGKANLADYGTPTIIHVNDPKASTMEQLFDEARETRDRKAGR